MKLLYCNPSFWDYRLPFFLRLRELLCGEFQVIFSTKRYVGKEKLLERIKEQLGDSALVYDNELMYDIHTRSFSKYSEEYKQIPMPLGLYKRISKAKPDVIISEGFFQWTPWAMLYSLINKVPVFVNYERTLHTERNTKKFVTWTRKMSDKIINGYLVNGVETKKYLLSIGVKEEKIHIVGMSADSTGLRNAISTLSEEDKATFRKQFITSGRGLLYLFTGKLILRKGVDHLLEAWKKHSEHYPEDRLVLVGDGEYYQEWKNQYSNVTSVIFEGRVEYTEIHKYYAIADVYVLPTIEDNWSLVVPEAMACGLPVATSIYNGCYPELIHKDENGITFDTFDNDSIVNALDYFHHIDLHSFGEKSKEIESHYNTESCTDKVYQVIKGCM